MNIKAVEGCGSEEPCDVALQSSLWVIISFHWLPMTVTDSCFVFRGSEKVFRSIYVLIFPFSICKISHLLENVSIWLLMIKLLIETQVGLVSVKKFYQINVRHFRLILNMAFVMFKIWCKNKLTANILQNVFHVFVNLIMYNCLLAGIDLGCALSDFC